MITRRDLECSLSSRTCFLRSSFSALFLKSSWLSHSLACCRLKWSSLISWREFSWRQWSSWVLASWRSLISCLESLRVCAKSNSWREEEARNDTHRESEVSLAYLLQQFTFKTLSLLHDLLFEHQQSFASYFFEFLKVLLFIDFLLLHQFLLLIIWELLLLCIW